MSEKSLRIVQLTAENIKRLQAVTITPEGNLEIIGGNNANGKTSVLDSIMYALAGGKSIPAAPIRRGQKKARVQLDLGEFVVERRFTSKGSILEVKAANGLIQTSPQAILDRLTGNLSFDPLAFVNMKPADQLKTLKDLVGIDFDDLEVKRQSLYGERGEVNKEVKQLEGQLEGIPETSALPNAPVVVGDLIAQLEEVEAHNQEVTECERQLERLGSQITDIDAELERLRARAVQIKAEKAALEVARGAIDIPALLDTSEIKTQIQSAEEINQKVRDATERKRVDKLVKSKRSESTKLTLAIEKIDEEKEARLASVEFPIAGLSFSEEGVLLNGLPFEQGSSAEQLKTSVAMGFAQHPRLKIALIRDGSLLDESSLKTIAEMAEEHGAQCWVERVGKGAECSVIIENGMVEGEENGD